MGRALDHIMIADMRDGEVDILDAAALREHPPTQSADHSQRSRDFAVSSPDDGGEVLLDVSADDYTVVNNARPALASFATGAMPSLPAR